MAIQVVGLLLAGLGGGAAKKRAEPSLPTGKAEGWEFAVVGGGEMSVSSEGSRLRDSPERVGEGIWRPMGSAIEELDDDLVGR